MKLKISILLLLLTNILLAQNKPFPLHTGYLGSFIQPTNYTQEELDTQLKNFYTQWKSVYLKSGCNTGEYYVDFAVGNTISVSEGLGYGMMIMPLIAGHETYAKVYFDGMYKFYKAHPSGINPYLMAWKQIDGCIDADGNDSASDGDIDIAFGLLLAHDQWGSTGDINYFSEAKNIINAIMQDDINKSLSTVKLGDWASATSPNTRTSDFIMDHFRAFKTASSDNKWTNVINKCYTLIDDMQTNYASTTGLLPDFIINVNSTPKPANPNFLEGENDGGYYYNACRDPWRITTDYLISGDERAKTSVNKINNWLMQKTNNDVSEIVNGYELNGTEIATWDDATFIGSFAVGAMLNTENQDWLNNIYARLLGYGNSGGYYENTLKLLYMMVISGNYWSPSAVLGVETGEFQNKEFDIRTINNERIEIRNLTEKRTNSELKLIDINGKLLVSKKLKNKIEQIDISNLQKGMYFISLKPNNTNTLITQKIIKL